MTELEAFCKAMAGEWVVERYELEGERLRVHYRSLLLPAVTWSHMPFNFDQVPPVGTTGRIGFNWHVEAH